MKQSIRTTIAVFSVVGAMAIMNAQAAITLIRPTSAQASSTGGTGGYSANGMWNSSSFAPQGALYPTGSSAPGTWATTTAIFYNEPGWMSPYRNGTDVALGGTISFDLGASYQISGFHYWNYNADDLNRGIWTADLQIATLSDFSDAIDLGTITLAKATDGTGASSTYTGSDFRFLESLLPLSVTGEYVKLTNLENYSGGFDAYVGLGQIRFETGVVPEPSTVMLLGLGSAVLWFRRRQHQAA